MVEIYQHWGKYSGVTYKVNIGGKVKSFINIDDLIEYLKNK